MLLWFVFILIYSQFCTGKFDNRVHTKYQNGDKFRKVHAISKRHSLNRLANSHVYLEFYSKRNIIPDLECFNSPYWLPSFPPANLQNYYGQLYCYLDPAAAILGHILMALNTKSKQALSLAGQVPTCLGVCKYYISRFSRILDPPLNKQNKHDLRPPTPTLK